jgi:predicted amidohydrolase
MKFKIAVAQIHSKIGALQDNLEKHLRYIEQAIDEQANIIVFPELSLTGYTLRDLVPEVALKAEDAFLKPILERSERITIGFGLVEMSEEYFYYNCGAFAEEGKIAHTQRKIYPPTYGVFEEKRFFAQGHRISAFNLKFGRFGNLICNDARHPALAYILAMDGAKYLITQSCVPARGYPKGDKPGPLVYFETGNRFYSSTFGCYSIFVNLAGNEESLLFCGGSHICAPGGDIIAEAPLFEEAMIFAELSEEKIREFRTVTPILGEENMDLLINEMGRINRRRFEI